MKQLSILVGGYGDYPQYTLRCLESILSEPETSGHFEVLVGLNAAGERTRSEIRRLRDEGKVHLIVDCADNLNKDPVMRALLALVRTPYILWLDDDLYLKPGWGMVVLEFLKFFSTFDVAGFKRLGRRSQEYRDFVERRPWFRAWKPETAEVPFEFPLGGMWLGRAGYLREHAYPDYGMVKHCDDFLLGEMIDQTGGHFIDLNGSALEELMVLEDIPRRGTGVDETDGWMRSVCPLSGEVIPSEEG